MTMVRFSRCLVIGAMAVATLLRVSISAQAVEPPAVGDAARNYTLARLDGQRISVDGLLEDGPVVMVMLRGWVGYQCPLCIRQFGDFLRHADAFEMAGADVVWVYPGDADSVQGYAEEFVTGQTLPGNFHFVIDPDLHVVEQYGLRWDAPGETAYPSTFVFDRDGMVRFVKISHTHGDRASAVDVLAAIQGDD